MNKQNTKNSKGITLVALIITIVVLLILAGVAIGAVKDSGIIGHAQNAATSYNQKKTEEEDVLTDAEGLLGNLVNSINKDNNKTPNQPSTAEVRYYKGEDIIQEFKITGNNGIANLYSISDDNITHSQGPFTISINSVVNPVTITLDVGSPIDITTSDKQVELSGTISGYIKGNYLYGVGYGGNMYSPFLLITDSAEIEDIEGKIANINS